MFFQTKAHIRDAAPSDLHKLANLIHFETFVHRHLDYRPPLDWLGKDPFLVIEQGKTIAAALACQPDPPPVAWIRLFAASTSSTLAQHWGQLWEEARDRLAQIGAPQWAAAIPMQMWFEELLTQSGFEQSHKIMTLHWERRPLPTAHEPQDARIRPMTLDDLEPVERVDAASFPPIWRHSRAYLELAFRQAAIATIIEKNGRLVGYQISTATPMGGHLARLAIEPHLQGHGLGQALLHDLLAQFTRRGARAVTVNTQTNNEASLALYARMGFNPTGEQYSIYQVDLA